jgi:hypothetical protein
MELQPLGIEDLKRMLGEKDIIIEQLTQAILRQEAGKAAREAAEKPAEEPAP